MQANTSIFHFHRLFRAFMGRSLAEYIRERRLYYAARDLVETKKSIFDIAFEYGYSSGESFLRAFKSQYGQTPRRFRKIRNLPPFMSMVNLMDGNHHGAKGRLIMNPKIKVLDSLRIIGTRIQTSHSSCHEDVSDLWKDIHSKASTGLHDELSSVDAIYSVCYGSCNGCSCTGNTHSGSENFAFFIGYQAQKEKELPAGTFETTIHGGTYALFSLKISEMQQTMDQIYSQWLPKSGYELDHYPIIERYGKDWQEKKEGIMEIWLPLKVEAS